MTTTRVGRQTSRGNDSVTERGKAAEALFEEYLRKQRVSFEYEPPRPDVRERPDYRVPWNDHVLVCEVKEHHQGEQPPAGAAHFNPYDGIRRRIEKARKKFRGYKDYCCVLILHNVDDWQFRDRPYILFGAMLGDAGQRIPFDPQRGTLVMERARPTFLEGGKMIAPKSGSHQNTTISAIGVLSEFEIPNPEFEEEYEKRLAALQRGQATEPTIGQRLETRWQLHEGEQYPQTLGRCPRVCLFENPVARKKLPDGVFRGAYDARYRYSAKLGRIERVFAGGGLLEAERLRQHGGDILQEIERFKQAVVEHFSPERIVLFGSHAHEVAEPDSDVDLLVVFSGDGDLADRSLEIRRKVNPDFAMDLLTRSAGEIDRRIRRGDCFLKEIVENGKTLYPCSRTPENGLPRPRTTMMTPSGSCGPGIG